MLKRLNIGVGDAISLLFGLVGVFSWFGVTPEMVGNGIYSFTRAAIPVIEFILGAWFTRSMLTRQYEAEKTGFVARINQIEGKAQAYAEEKTQLKEENKGLAFRIDELEAEKLKPNFSYLSEEEKAMVASAFESRELFPTPDTSIFTYPDITLSQLQKRNIVRKVCVRKVGAVNIDMWQIEPAATEAIDGNPGLLNQLRDAFTHMYDAAIEKRKEEELEQREELLDGYSCELSQIDVSSRALLRALILGYNVYCPSSHWSKDEYENDALLESLVDWKFESDAAVQLFPTDLLMAVYEHDSELLERNVGEYLSKREGAPNGWANFTMGRNPRFDFPWFWEKSKGDEHVQ